MFRISRTFYDVTLFRISKRYHGTHSKKKTHYEVLGVDKNASKKDIRLAFLMLSKQMHPDTGNKEGHSEFIKINEAYNVLSKENLRRNYDIDLNNEKNPYHSTFRRPNKSSTVYYRQGNSNKWQEWSGPTRNGPSPQGSPNFEENYYQARNGRLNPFKIFFICMAICAIGTIIRITAYVTSTVPRIKKQKQKTIEYNEEIERLREQNRTRSRNEGLSAFYQKVIDHADENTKR